MNRNLIPIVLIERIEGKRSQPADIPRWLVFLAYLAYLRAMRPHPPAEATVLRLLGVIVGLVLVVVALVAAGAPDQVAEALKAWPMVP
jgi:drug/metabolite transporter (DMT)-like permease